MAIEYIDKSLIERGVPNALYRVERYGPYEYYLVKHRTVLDRPTRYKINGAQWPVGLNIRVHDKEAFIDYRDQDYYLDLIEVDDSDFLSKFDISNLNNILENQFCLLNLYKSICDNQDDVELFDLLLADNEAAKICMSKSGHSFYYYEIKPNLNSAKTISSNTVDRIVLVSLEVDKELTFLFDNNLLDKAFKGVKNRSDFCLVDIVYSIKDEYDKTGILNKFDLNQYEQNYIRNKFILPFLSGNE